MNWTSRLWPADTNCTEKDREMLPPEWSPVSQLRFLGILPALPSPCLTLTLRPWAFGLILFSYFVKMLSSPNIRSSSRAGTSNLHLHLNWYPRIHPNKVPGTYEATAHMVDPQEPGVSSKLLCEKMVSTTRFWLNWKPHPHFSQPKTKSVNMPVTCLFLSTANMKTAISCLYQL